MSAYWPSLIGGMLLGLSAVALLLLDGRIAGISGIVGRLLGGGQVPLNAAFVVGLISGPPLYMLAFGSFPSVTIAAAWPPVLAAGLAVGIGTRMGSGCTSGHGVCGIARLSPRSIAATLTFMVTAFATVYLLRHVIGG